MLYKLLSPAKIGLEVFSWKASPSGFVAECFSIFVAWLNDEETFYLLGYLFGK